MLMVDSERRVDLFLSFHGNEKISCVLTTRDLIRKVVDEVRRRCFGRGAKPGIFFDETSVRAHLTEDIFTSVLQLRGGGLGLCFLTPKFFDYPWCISELCGLLKVHQQRDHYVRLRFFCLGCQPKDIIHLAHVREFADSLRGFSLKPFSVSFATCTMVDEIADLIFEVWDGRDGVSDKGVSVLGENRGDCMKYLQSRFMTDGENANEEEEQKRGCSVTEKEAGLIGYYRKWEYTKCYDWNVAEVNKLGAMFHDIRMTLLERYKARDADPEDWGGDSEWDEFTYSGGGDGSESARKRLRE